MSELTIPLPNRKRNHPRIRLLKESSKTYSNLSKPKVINTKRWNKYYGSMSWHRLREAKLLDQPLCERCLSLGKVTAAECIHHRIVFGSAPTDELRWQLFLDMDNLVSLCTACHRHIHDTKDSEWMERLD